MRFRFVVNRFHAPLNCARQWIRTQIAGHIEPLTRSFTVVSLRSPEMVLKSIADFLYNPMWTNLTNIRLLHHYLWAPGLSGQETTDSTGPNRTWTALSVRRWTTQTNILRIKYTKSSVPRRVNWSKSLLCVRSGVLEPPRSINIFRSGSFYTYLLMVLCVGVEDYPVVQLKPNRHSTHIISVGKEEIILTQTTDVPIRFPTINFVEYF